MNGQRTEQLTGMMPGLGPSQRTEELDSTTSATGQLRLVDFAVGTKLGEGGSAAVHAAVHKPTGKRVALKTIHREYGNDPKFVGRFEREVRAAASLVHPNICEVVGWGRDDGQLFLAMELVEGESLAALLHRVGALPAQVAAVVLDELLDAIGCAHAAGILHRDVKPANLMITRDGVLKLLDFGIAKRRDDIKVTETGHLVGTPAYMSPEHAAGDELDSRSDLYSCGVALYEMLVGTNPFEKLGTSTTLLRIVNEGIAPIFEHAVTTPGALEVMFERLSDRLRDRRFQTAAAARAELAPYVAFAKRDHPDVVRWFLQDPVEHKVQLDKEMAAIETLRASDLETEGEASLPAAAIALWRAVNLDPVNSALQTRFQAIADRAGAHFDAPTSPALKEVVDDAIAFATPGAFKRAADMLRAAGYFVPAVVFLRRYLREQPSDSHAARQLEVLVAGTQAERARAANQRSGLRTVDIIAGVKTAGPILPAPPRGAGPAAGSKHQRARPSSPEEAARVAREDARAVATELRLRVADAALRETGATRAGLGSPQEHASDGAPLARLFLYGAAVVGVLFVLGWLLKVLVFAEVVATQRMVSDNTAQVGIAEVTVAEKRRENLLLDARALVNQRTWEEALLKIDRLMAEEGLPATQKGEALYLRGMAYRGVGDRLSARRAFLDYSAVAPTTDIHFAEVRHLIDELSHDDALRKSP